MAFKFKTWDDFHDWDSAMKGYNIFRKNRPGTGGYWWTVILKQTSNVPLQLHQAEHCLLMKKGVSSPLFNTGETTPEVLHPLVGSLLQQRDKYTAETLVKDSKDD